MNSILVVDDDQELRENLQEVLAGDKYEVTLAKNGTEALEIVKDKDFDLMLLDLIMPGLSGMETLMLLHRQKPQIRVVLMTAFSTVENAVEAMRRGADDYLTKPFKSADLLTTLRRVLEEAKFKACQMTLNMDGTFNSLANPIRRQILQLLVANARLRFMDVTRGLGIDDHTKVNFHLKVLKENGLIDQDDQRFYCLTTEGEKVSQCMNFVINNLTS
ncbi:response regulator [Geopsychrobacter electrodiphilus]|uniref:response regulator n=1 Tax=Geopsychrobacter electrodiphilus TaxID=225196 RepID=UPI00037842B5|nr:response regulator [Geopsychrobacter electrodiphilus]